MRIGTTALSCLAWAALSILLHSDAQASLPRAPAPIPSTANPAQTVPLVNPMPAAPRPATAPGPRLTREDAERMALVNNPRVSVSHLLAPTRA